MAFCVSTSTPSRYASSVEIRSLSDPLMKKGMPFADHVTSLEFTFQGMGTATCCPSSRTSRLFHLIRMLCGRRSCSTATFLLTIPCKRLPTCNSAAQILKLSSKLHENEEPHMHAAMQVSKPIRHTRLFRTLREKHGIFVHLKDTSWGIAAYLAVPSESKPDRERESLQVAGIKLAGAAPVPRAIR